MGGSTEAVAHRGGLRHASTLQKPRETGMRWFDRQFPRLAVLPTTMLMLLVFGIPLLFSASLSTEAWSPDQSLFGGTLAGAANYDGLISDPEFAGSLLLTLGYTAGALPAELGIGLAIAMLLNIDLKWIGLFRSLLIVPMMITPVVARCGEQA